ncbi:MAG: hypothetical protein QGG36_30340 [Pirellulaceae bacterium]|jgi:hypothetical protein|nr:hypothetical protein [Pirellulaceae bacterium]MDP7020136.1 hypothetical protein [Pirellulaceae bacterium]
MNILSSLFSSKKGKATSLYKRGLKKAKTRDLEGAVADYTAVIEMEGAPGDIKIVSQFNRGLAYSTDRRFDEARADLEAVLANPLTPADVKDATRQKLKRMERRISGSGGEDDS